MPTYHCVLKHYIDENEIEILGNYISKLLCLDYICKDIEMIRKENKIDLFETQLTENDSVFVFRRQLGYVYNTKHFFLKYIILEVDSEVIDE